MNRQELVVWGQEACKDKLDGVVAANSGEVFILICFSSFLTKTSSFLLVSF